MNLKPLSEFIAGKTFRDIRNAFIDGFFLSGIDNPEGVFFYASPNPITGRLPFNKEGDETEGTFKREAIFIAVGAPELENGEAGEGNSIFYSIEESATGSGSNYYIDNIVFEEAEKFIALLDTKATITELEKAIGEYRGGNGSPEYNF